MQYLTTLYTLILALPAAIVLGSVGYLLILLAAAARAGSSRRLGACTPVPPATRFAVLIPAHDEEMVLEATLQSLRTQDYPERLYEIIVIADNSTDRTAGIARDYGVTVLERVDQTKRGKGYALDWAMQRLLAAERPADAFVIIDADTWVALDFLSRAADGLARGTDSEGRCALQGRYGVLNAREGWRATLMAAALDLFNHVKPLGRDELGLSVGLKGNGMVFSRRLLEQARWRGDSVTEDIDFGLDLAQTHGVRVGYLPDARVLAQMPATAKQAASQRERWERGRYRLVRERALPLLAEGLRRRNGLLIDSSLDLLLPPLAEIGTTWFLWSVILGAGAAMHLVAHPIAWAVLLLCGGVGLLAYILGGLRVAEAPREAYVALMRAPLYATWKMLLYLRKFGRIRRSAGERDTEWVRTDRTPVSGATAPANPSSEGRAA